MQTTVKYEEINGEQKVSSMFESCERTEGISGLISYSLGFLA